ncbi:MAG: peptidoglycan-binding protein [Proteobacteria bacterium]|nr:peptidoglycan-binding protein [Pseudomonadota bacterium]
MSVRLSRLIIGGVACFACVTMATPFFAQTATLRLHAALEGDDRPFLCADRATVGLVVAVLARAIEARAAGDADKAQRVFELAARLQAEICTRPAADDIVILRCKLDQRDIAGTNVTLAKISAVMRAQTSKGEQPFFAWTYRGIEGGAASAEDAAKAQARWCADGGGDDETVRPSPDLVLRIQHRLYDFGLHVPRISGELTPETSQALTDFQKWAGLPATGQLTKATVLKIDATPAPSSWAAIAFDGFGNYSVISGPTRRSSEADAADKLRRRSRADFKIASVASPRCIAIATTRYRERTGRRRTTTYTQAFTSIGDSANSAEENVLAYCGRQKGGGECVARESICAVAAGAGPDRFDNKNIPVNAEPPRFNREVPAVNAAPPRFDPKNIPANTPAPR